MATSYRHGFGSPPKYRRSTMEIYHSLETGQHSPTVSVLDRKWVHRSLGDLTSENDLQLSHPRLASKFYQDLYQKYPRAFHRRREARDAGRKLFNPKLHVKFEDEIVDDMSLKSYRSERPTTNWDREVGHYKNTRPRSRDCFTSAEPSETGSVLSVKERLHLNSQTLHRLLNEKSPLRKRFSEESNSMFRNENSPNNEHTASESVLSNRPRLRFRHKKVLQRKVDNKQNGANNGHLGQLRKPTSLSAEYSRRARTVSPTNSKHRHVDVEALIANADLEINTLLEKISMKMSSPESPPDSAIDVDTPSLRSLATTDRGSNSDLPLSVPHEHVLQDFGDIAKSVESQNGAESLYVDTDVTLDKTKYCSEEEMLDPLKDPDNILLLKEYDMNIDDIQLPKGSRNERTSKNSQENSEGSLSFQKQNTGRFTGNIYDGDINLESVDNFDITNFLTQNNHDMVGSGTGQGMLQFHKTESKYNGNEGLLCASEVTEGIKSVEYSETDLISCNRTKLTNKSPDLSKSDNELLDSSVETIHPTVKGDRQQVHVHGPDLEDSNQDKNYQADDEAEGHEDTVSKIQLATTGCSRKLPLHRDSDVDSGIGQSGTETRSPLPVPPPRGRSRKRGETSKTQPVRADHNILPLRSEVDTCILNEVDLTKLSHDLSLDHRRGHQSDEADDTVPRRETVKVTTEQSLTEKYRRQRSPSPFVLRGSRQASPRFRAQSAPLYYSEKLDLHVVDISLSNESLSDISSSVSTTLNNVSVSGIDSFNASNFNHHKSVPNEMSCQTDDLPASSIHSSKKWQQPDILSSGSVSVQSHGDTFKSSSPTEQRKSSTSTYSVTSVSSADTETTLNNVQLNNMVNGNVEEHVIDNSKDTVQNGEILENGKENMDTENNRTDSYEEYANVTYANSTNKVESEYNKQTNGDSRHLGQSEISETEQNPSTENLYSNHLESANQNLPDNHDTRKHQTIEHQVFANEEHIEPTVNRRNNCIEDSNFHSAKKIEIVKPKIDTQISVESKDSFESVELSEPEVADPHHEQYVREVKRIYKPSVNSPRVNEKKTNMRSIFKHKKGRFSPGIEQTMQHDNQKDIVLISCDRPTPERLRNQDSPETNGQEHVQKVQNGIHETQNMHNKMKAGIIIENDDLSNAKHQTYSAKPVVINPDGSSNRQNAPSSHEQHLSRLKNNLRAELNLSKYKISKQNDLDQSNDQKFDKLSQSSGSRWSQDSQRSYGSSGPVHSPASQGSPRSRGSQGSYGEESEVPTERSVPAPQHDEAIKKRPKQNDEEIIVEESNLQKSKHMSASKGSLLDKMGGLKIATKGKFKAMRKAMSLERGIDQVGKDPQGHSKQDGKGGHSFLPKMKKGPSLKSIAGLFGRKKKKGKYTAEDVEASTSGTNPSGSSGSTSSLSNDKRKQWASCHTLSSIENPPDTRPLGRLVKMNPDGSQIVELRRPANGHLGFFIAQGNPKYKKGVFVSRFSKDSPENMLAGLLGVGDEILEVNRHLVHDLSLDAVYKLMGASSTITLKIFPLIARRDL